MFTHASIFLSPDGFGLMRPPYMDGNRCRSTGWNSLHGVSPKYRSIGWDSLRWVFLQIQVYRMEQPTMGVAQLEVYVWGTMLQAGFSRVRDPMR
jgi:hypothetical protein